MSLLDKASLIVTPNAYKESKLYSVVPSSGAGDMDVVRATTATRVNSAGLIEVVPRNLFTYSEQFDNAAWTKINATVTANATNAPNGMLTADKLIATAVSGLHIALQTPTGSISGENFTTSVFVKASGLSRITLLNNQGGGGIVDYNLTTGTFTLVSGVSASIQSLDNGWYRCIMTFTPNSTGNFNLQVRLADSSGNTTFTGNGVDGVFVWGFQVEQGSTATEYFPTTTRLNIPRIDYTNGSCPSLLVEPQRTNNALYSNSFNNWVVGGTLTQNFAISPDGTQNASSLNGYMYEGSNGVGGIVSFSCFAKKINGDNTITLIADSTPAKQAVFNLLNGTVVSVDSGFTANIVNFGNGWYRCIMTSTSSIISPLLIIRSASSGTNSTLVYGVQFEQGSYPTSYIPTVASSVTRNADVISKTGISSLIGQTEGTIFLDFYYNYSDSTTQVLLKASQSNDSNSVGIEIQNNSLKAIVNSSGSNIATLTNTISTGRIKCAIAYKSNDMVFYVNGSLVGTDTSGTINFANNVDMLTIGHFNLLGTLYFQSSRPFNSVQLYKTRLSNTELAQLTTL